MLLYYITDRTQFSGDEHERQTAVLKKIEEASRCGVDFVQLREKDLCTRDLEKLARAAEAVVRQSSAKTRLLINSRSDVAIACAADGVHLRSADVSPRDLRSVWTGSSPIIAVSCHSEADIVRAASEGVDFVVFAPVFEKKGATQVRPAGLETLRAVCRQQVPLLALGGVTLENAPACMEAGAAGVAGIRLFQENDIAEIVRTLRA